MRKNYYSEKVLVVEKLVSLNKKKITNEEIRKVATECNLPMNSAKSAWETFQQTSGKYIDKRCRQSSSGKTIKAVSNYATPTKAKANIGFNEAGEIILEYMNDTKLNSRSLCTKHGISVQQFYSWIKELDVSGTLLGKMVLNPKKYGKVCVVDAIWYAKRPNTKRASIIELTSFEKLALSRVAQVLENYLK